MKTWGSKRVDKLIVKSPAAIKFALGENPKNTYNDRDETPVTRMATAAIIREQLIKAKRYSEDIAEYERLKGTEDEISRPDFDIKCEALLPLFDKEHPLKAHFHCHRADDIFTAQRLANEFGLDYVLIHCTDGALIADELAEDSPATPIQYLPLTAALAVRGGLSSEEALRGITITAAEILGVSDRIGSVEPGKDADFTLYADEPVSMMTQPLLTAVRGKVAVNKII